MKTLIILCVIIGVGSACAATTPHVTATWGGNQVKLIEIKTGKTWFESYDDFFRNCGKHHPKDLGVRVLGMLPSWYKGPGSTPPGQVATAIDRDSNTKVRVPVFNPDLKREPAPQAPKSKTVSKKDRGDLTLPHGLTSNTGPEGLLLLPQMPTSLTLLEAHRMQVSGEDPQPRGTKLQVSQTQRGDDGPVPDYNVMSLLDSENAAVAARVFLREPQPMDDPPLPIDVLIPTVSIGDFSNESLVRLVKKFEGFKSKAYWDHAQYSIGYGTRATSKSEVITEAQADARLRSHLAAAAREVDAAAKEHGVVLNSKQRAALTSFHFNTGSIKRVLELAAGETSAVPSIMQRWRTAGGKVHPGLVTRRAKEAGLYASN